MKLFFKHILFAYILSTTILNAMQVPKEEDFNREKDFFLVKNEIVNKVGAEFRSGQFPFTKSLLNREVLQAEYLYDKESLQNPYRFPDIRHLFYKKKDLTNYINKKIRIHDDWLRFTNRFLTKYDISTYDTYVNFSGVPFSQRFKEFMDYEALEKKKWQHLLVEVRKDPQSYLLSGPLHPHKITGVDALHDNGITGEDAEVVVWDCGFVNNKYVNFNPRDSQVLDPIPGDIEDPGYESDDEHGTHVSGILAGVGSGRLRKNKGVACGASVLPATYSGIPDLIDRIKDSKAKVISASFHFLLRKDNQGYLDKLADELEKNDRLLVMAAGNDGKFLNKDICPDFLEFWARGMWVGNHLAMIFDKNSRLAKRMVLVGSLKEDGRTVSRFSNLPGQLSDHFVFAPGENVVSTVAFNKFDKMSGTSMATPHVSGILVLLNKYYPNLSALDLKDCLAKSCDPFWKETSEVPFNNTIHGCGRVNAVKAMELAEKLSQEKAWHEETRAMMVVDDMEIA
jgi:hypothetical protein